MSNFQGWYVLKNEFWKIIYFNAVNGKFGSFIIKADRFRRNRCKSMGKCVNFFKKIIKNNKNS
jgi:hypothetical protein